MSKVVRRLIDEALAGQVPVPQPVLTGMVESGLPIPIPVSGPVPISALPPPTGGGGGDPMVSELVADAPKHWHKREAVETHWEQGQRVTTYRCSVCGVGL